MTFYVAKVTFYVPMITFVYGKDVTKTTFCVAKFFLCGQMKYSVTTMTFYVVQIFVCEQDHFLCGYGDILCC